MNIILEYGVRKRIEKTVHGRMHPEAESAVGLMIAANTRVESLDAPDNEETYFWRASTLGRWGQIKGVFEALYRMKEMREDLIQSVRLNPLYSPSWYVLSYLYEQLPGGFISFGNPDISVSLGRQAVDARQAMTSGETGKSGTLTLSWDYYTQLARALYKRNWDAKKRFKEQEAKKRLYAEAVDTFEKGSVYEGVCELTGESDREEARRLAYKVVDTLLAVEEKTPQQIEDLEKAMLLVKRMR